MEIVEGSLEEIAALQPGLYLEHHIVMAAAALRRIGESPCVMRVTCEGFEEPPPPFLLRVRWRRHTERLAHKIVRSEQRTPIVERAAIAVTTLLLGKMLPDSDMIVTAQGERADYWLPGRRYALEISGTDSQDALTARLRKKKKQVHRNPLGWDGYAVVCCFSKEPAIIWSEIRHGHQP